MRRDKLNQQEVADAIGVSQPTVGRWLDNKFDGVKAIELKKLAELFSVPYDYFFMDSVPAPLAIRETPPQYHVDDLLKSVQDLREQCAAVERAAKRLKPKP